MVGGYVAPVDAGSKEGMWGDIVKRELKRKELKKRDVVLIEYPQKSHEVKYVAKVGVVKEILGTSEGEQIVVVSMVSIEETFMGKQLKVLKRGDTY